MTDARPSAPSTRRRLGALAGDVACILVFATVGRASHDGISSVGDVLWTALPFLVALGVGWFVTLAWRAPLAPGRVGVPLAAVTVLVGMLGRALLGEGTALPFVVVATVTVLLLLVGWRLVARLVVGRRRTTLAGGSSGRRR
ncbi:hypothetical protein GCM10009846_03190 [Agrococcus versicolor]|uniref:DUF3054 domain-containing protein n=1 Tax=Agrococcus versicolor TaxID=501482 RepID=A0ABN3AJQ0_9MICO